MIHLPGLHCRWTTFEKFGSKEIGKKVLIELDDDVQLGKLKIKGRLNMICPEPDCIKVTTTLCFVTKIWVYLLSTLYLGSSYHFSLLLPSSTQRVNRLNFKSDPTKGRGNNLCKYRSPNSDSRSEGISFKIKLKVVFRFTYYLSDWLTYI